MRSSLWSSWSTTWLSRYTDVPLHMSNLANAEIPDQSRFFSDALRHHYFFSSPLEWELLKARNCVRSLSIYPASPFHHENLQLYPTVGRKVQWTTITQLQQLSLLCQFYQFLFHHLPEFSEPTRIKVRKGRRGQAYKTVLDCYLQQNDLGLWQRGYGRVFNTNSSSLGELMCTLPMVYSSNCKYPARDTALSLLKALNASLASDPWWYTNSPLLLGSSCPGRRLFLRQDPFKNDRLISLLTEKSAITSQTHRYCYRTLQLSQVESSTNILWP